MTNKEKLQEIRKLMWPLYVIKSEKKIVKNKYAEREAELTKQINDKIKEYNKAMDSKKLSMIYLDYTDAKTLEAVSIIDNKIKQTKD